MLKAFLHIQDLPQLFSFLKSFIPMKNTCPQHCFSLKSLMYHVKSVKCRFLQMDTKFDTINIVPRMFPFQRLISASKHGKSSLHLVMWHCATSAHMCHLPTSFVNIYSNFSSLHRSDYYEWFCCSKINLIKQPPCIIFEERKRAK